MGKTTGVKEQLIMALKEEAKMMVNKSAEERLQCLKEWVEENPKPLFLSIYAFIVACPEEFIEFAEDKITAKVTGKVR